MKQDWTKLKRTKHRMPEFMRQALTSADLMSTYHRRPPYQQNDYVWWISSAKRDATKQKRVGQMIEELKLGNVYMGMRWSGTE